MGCFSIDCNEGEKPENDGRQQKQVGVMIDEELRVRQFYRKMKWGLGLMILSGARRKTPKKMNKEGEVPPENNKAWLLAESGAVAADSGDPQSMHSSFRFSFGSQVELESFSLSSAAATVLLVNLDKGSKERSLESKSRELQIRRIESLEKRISSVAGELIRFSYAEIRSATRDFSRGRVLGRGALSCVFRGRIGFGRVVAIKRLDNEDKESTKAFCRELMIANSLSNGNIVRLVGFGMDQEGLFLVYKYVSGGNLEHHLHGKKRSLSWSVRYKVAVGVGQAIAYLHNGTDKCVVHRDIKPSNILLSSKKIPKLCDFGLATWTSAPSVPFLCKTVKGTFGYLAPEYFQHGKVSDKTDVYAFGVVLLELITGRKPIETRRTPMEENLILWARPLLQQEGNVTELLDPRLKPGSYSLSQVKRVVRAAAACLNGEESGRPSINRIVYILQGNEDCSNDRSVSDEQSCVGCYPQSHDVQATKREMKSHLALAMVGVMDLDEDDMYSR